MLASQKLAIAAHLHVLLRRKTGRVTDTEWMAGNADYAREIIRFSRAKALEDGHPDLAEWAGKLEQAVFEPAAVPKPLAQAAANIIRERRPPPADTPASGFAQSTSSESGFLESTFGSERPRKPRDPDAPRYVGGIR
ncbi:MAG: hypothetical protein EON92_06575 [Burkholderiales bacterium]|nr:MAG: hypothetical protein EON92_06575 [Burkholderiales bacterium]